MNDFTTYKADEVTETYYAPPATPRRSLPVVRIALVLLALAACLTLMAVAARGQEPVVYAPVYTQPYYVQPAPIYVAPRPVGVYVRYRRPTVIGQMLFGDFFVWTPVVQPVQMQPPPATTP